MEDVFEDMIQGWIAFAQQLAFAMSRHAGQHRRTLFFSGSSLAAAHRSAAALLELDAARAGERYTITPMADGSLSGTVWHRARHQLGVTVDGWGDGLLVVMDRPANDRWPVGGSQAILTTYGLDDAAFEALRTRWTAWWDAHFGPSAQTSCD